MTIWRSAIGYSFAITTYGSAFAAVVAVVIGCIPTVAALASWSVLGWLFLALAAAAPLGWWVGGLLVWPFVFQAARRMNGAPFRVGDTVVILVGPHRQRTSCIYELWTERRQVRVDLGPEAGKAVADVFSEHEIVKTKAVEPGATDNPDDAQ